MKIGVFGPWLGFRLSVPSWRLWVLSAGLVLGEDGEWGVMFDIGPLLVEVFYTETDGEGR